jgi:hypothetical protein
VIGLRKLQRKYNNDPESICFDWFVIFYPQDAVHEPAAVLLSAFVASLSR